MTQVQEFAKLVLSHHAKDEVIDRIALKLIKSFRDGDSKIREEVVRVMDSQDLFFSELQAILDESIDINDSIEPDKGDTQNG